MTYFAQIVDAWDCEVDFFGPYNSAEDAENAAWEKWDGSDDYKVYIVQRLPASFH
jgi:hypothetical protein